MNYMRMLFLLSLSVGVLTSCERNSHDSENLYRIAVVSYQHETCTFCPGGDTEIGDWTVEKPYIEDDELLRSGSYIRGFVTASERFGDVELIGIKSPHKVFGGSSRSWNSKASFDHFMDLILQDIQANMPLDAVYLALHGAMAVRDVPRPEAEIAKRIRELVGAEIPIVATLDLHGNEDEEFLEWADNAKLCKGFFGGGNRNFAQLFCVTVKELSAEFDIPVLHGFEFQGSAYDVAKLTEELEKIDRYQEIKD